ncbi:hypothetical protein [Parasitella parasitica]|uniref:ATP-dependent DNA helicase n=1 Tax=Parasitella parasitica TaxID=35722 RepID=A0A0B7NEF7_9FUNG|nr:hypothetical protein [Parasitella parasitica]
MASLNTKQRDIVSHVADHARHGNVLCIKLTKLYDLQRDRDLSSVSALLTGTTGKASYNIGGQTIHSTLSFSNCRWRGIERLSDDVANSMCVALHSLKVLIIDEVGIRSAKQFSFVHHRLQDIFHTDIPFGGINVILVGDFVKLRPIIATSIYTPSTYSIYSGCGEFGLNTEFLYRLYSIVCLMEIMRQRDDVP